MDAFITIAAARRRTLCEEAGQRLGLDASSMEKDFWVCWVLRELFSAQEFGPHLTFKGGTSLSKGWKLIQRFSEDIDVVVDRAFLGFGGELSPEHAPSNKQRERRLEDLRAVCQRHIQDVLTPALTERLRKRLGNESWQLELDSSDPDNQALLFKYPSAAAAAGAYIRPVVKIELGARSDTDPSETPTIQPYLAEALPELFDDAAFQVRTLAPERTFWEKASLLHEETYRPESSGPPARLARHYYDLWSLIGAGVAQRALANPDLFERVVAHRRVFFRRSREAQHSLKPGSLRLMPAVNLRPAWERDYAAMRETMFFGDVPRFDEILAVVEDFERQFNAGASSTA